MAEISIEIDGEEQLSRNLRVFLTRLDNHKEFHQGAIQLIGERSDEIFGAEGSNVEKAPRWKALAESTLAARSARHGYYKNPPNSPRVLRWTGRGQEDRGVTANDEEGKLTFNQEYMSYHQKGGAKLPKRVVVDLSNKTNAEIVRLLQEKINRDIGISGLQA